MALRPMEVWREMDMTAECKTENSLTRRRMLALGAGAVSAPLISGAARADDEFPAREIRIVCAFPAGSGADVLTRFYAEGMKPHFNKPIIVENRAGAGGNVATNYVARAKPDGYTLYIHGVSGLAANMHIYKDPGVDAGKTIEVLATVSKLAFVVAVRADAPWKNLQDLIAAMREKGEKGSYAITAPTGQVAGALMKVQMGLKTLEIPYRTGPDSMNDLLSGNIDFAMYDPTFALQHARPGKIRLLAIASRERFQSMPEVPTMHEQGVRDVNVIGWWGLMGPTGIPVSAKKKLQDAFYAMARAEKTRDFLVRAGVDPFILSPEEAQKFFLEEIETWGRYVKVAKIPQQG